MNGLNRPALTTLCFFALLVGCANNGGKRGRGDQDSASTDAGSTTPPSTATTAGTTPTGTGTATGTGTTSPTDTGDSTDTTSGTTAGTGTTSGWTTGTTPVGGPCDAPVDACPGGLCTVDLLPSTVEVQGQVLYDGAIINNDRDGLDFAITFVDAAGEETVYASAGGASIYAATLYPGVYDVWFELLDTTGTVTAPSQGRTRIARGVDFRSDTLFDVLPSPVSLSGLVTYDGVIIPDVESALWSVSLRETGTDSWLIHPKTGGTATYDIQVWPGSYDIYFEFIDSEGLPRSINGPTRITENITISSDTVVDLPVETLTMSGDIRWNGGPLRDDADGVANIKIAFEDISTGERLTTTLADGVSSYQNRIYAGEYAIWVELLDPVDAVTAPVLGEWRYIDSFIVADPGASLDLNIQPVQVSGSILYDSAMILGADETADWALHLTDVDSGATFSKSFQGGSATYEMFALPGVYDIDFELLDDTAVARPTDGISRIADAVDLTADTPLDVELLPVSLTGTLLYDGDMLARDDAGPDGQLWVTNRATGSSVAHPVSGGTEVYRVDLLPGNYNIDFELTDLNGAVLFPATGRFAAARDLSILGSVSLDILPETVQVGGAVLYDSLPIQAGAGQEWQVILTSREIETVALYAQSGGMTEWSVSTYAGVWDVGFELIDNRAVLHPVLAGRPFTGLSCADLHP